MAANANSRSADIVDFGVDLRSGRMTMAKNVTNLTERRAVLQHGRHLRGYVEKRVSQSGYL